MNRYERKLDRVGVCGVGVIVLFLATPPYKRRSAGFPQQAQGEGWDPMRFHNILNTLVIEARRNLNPSHARRIEEMQIRHRFFAPPKYRREQIKTRLRFLS